MKPCIINDLKQLGFNVKVNCIINKVDPGTTQERNLFEIIACRTICGHKIVVLYKLSVVGVNINRYAKFFLSRSLRLSFGGSYNDVVYYQDVIPMLKRIIDVARNLSICDENLVCSI